MTFVDTYVRHSDVKPAKAGPARATLCHGASSLTVFGPGPGDDETRYAIRLRLDAEAAVVIEGGAPAGAATAPIKLSDERLVLLSRNELANLHQRAGEILGFGSVSRPVRIEPGAMPTSHELLTSLTRPPLAAAIAAGAAPTSTAVLPARQRVRLLARIEAGLPMLALVLTIAMAVWGLRALRDGRDAASGTLTAAHAAQTNAVAQTVVPSVRRAERDGTPLLGGDQGPASSPLEPDATPAPVRQVAVPPVAAPAETPPAGPAQKLAMAIAAPSHPLAEAVPPQPAGVPAAPLLAAPPPPQQAETASPQLPAASPSPPVLVEPSQLVTATPARIGASLPAQPGPDAPMRLASLGTQAPATADPLAQSEGGPSTPHLSIHAKAASWVTLRDRQGRLVGERLLPGGGDWTPPQTNGLRLTTGNAGGTELVIDGARRITLGRDGAVRHDVDLDTITN